MLVTDLEMTGLDPCKNSIWQIGSLDLTNSKNIFFGECRIDKNEDISKKDEEIIGKSKYYLKDKNKQSEKELLKRFFNWVNKRKNKVLICYNSLDYFFLSKKAEKYNLRIPFNHRIFDIHSFVAFKYMIKSGKFNIKSGKSESGLGFALNFCGIPDNRIKIEKGDIIKEGSPHNALEDAKLAAEVFFRIVYKKNLLPEHKSFKIPNYLK
mgnify:CR=1 FL=1